jgi:predicted nucleic acid-binding protein
MRYVLDASVALRWVLPGSHATLAVQLRNEHQRKVHELIAPTLFLDEVASALTKAERQRIIRTGQAMPLYAMVMNYPPILLPHVVLIPRAMEISSQTRSSFYDCLYVALAEREGCELVTTDDKLVRNLQVAFPFVRHLSSLP